MKTSCCAALLLAVLSFSMMAQNAPQRSDRVNFTLLPTGQFVDSVTGEDYVVIGFPGDSVAHIYATLMRNISLVMNNPDKQIFGIEPSLIKAHAQMSLLVDKVMMLPLMCNGEVIFEFQIRDERVKVAAPSVTEPCHYGTTDNICYFSNVTKGYFKNGKLKEKKAGDYNKLLRKINNVVNTILGKGEVQTVETDW